MNEVTTVTGVTEPAVTVERADLMAVLAKSRHSLRFTTRDLTDELVAALPDLDATIRESLDGQKSMG